MSRNLQIENVPEKKRKIRNKILIICGTICILLIIAFIVSAFFFLPILRFQDALSRGEYERSFEIYNDNKDNAKFAEMAHSEALQRATALVNDYANTYLNVEDIQDAFVYLDFFLIDHEVREFDTEILSISRSRKAYKSGDICLENGDYRKAVDNFSQVTKEDILNYTKAQDCKNNAQDMIYEEIQSQANELLADGKTLEAFALYADLDPSYQSDTFRNDRKERQENFQHLVLQEIESMVSQEQYREILIYLMITPADLINDAVEQIKNRSIEEVFALAEEQARSGDIQDAILTLTDDNGKALDTKFSTTLSELNRQMSVERLQNMKADITIQYDKIDKEYNIVPKGLSTKYIDIGYNRNIEPWIVVDDNQNVLFTFFLGFRQSDWLFIDKIVIDCDKSQHTLYVDFWDRITDISGGSIAEIAPYGHFNVDLSKYGLESYDDPRLIDLEPIVEDMITADNVTIRFKGEGYKDVTVPSSHLKQLSEMWTAYKILKEDPTLVANLL